MKKAISIYMILGGLLLVGHSFFAEQFPDKGLGYYLLPSQIFLFVLFLKGHLFTVFLSKKFNLYLGQVFLGFSVSKFILAGLFMLYIKRFEDIPPSKSFVLFFMFSYFTYLLAEVLLVVKELNKNDNLPS